MQSGTPIAQRKRMNPAALIHRVGRRCATHRRQPRCAEAVALAAFVILITLGCRDSGGPAGPEPAIAGEWSGSAYAWSVRFDARFTQDGQEVGGTGHFSSPIESGDFTVTGTLVGRDVDLVLTSTELGATAFRGRFTGADRIEGTFDPEGSYETGLTLYRD